MAFGRPRPRWRRVCGCAALIAAGVLGASPAAALGQGTIETVAGPGDLNGPRGVSWMPDGGFLVADFWNSRVRRVAPGGTASTVAGTGVNGYNGDGQPATSAQLRLVHDVAGLEDGSFLIDDEENQRIRRVSTGGVISTVAGTGSKGFGGDGGPATSARIASPRGIAATSGGGFLIADSDNHRIRCVTPGGTIHTVAGNGTRGYGGDGGAAVAATLDRPFDVAPTYDGGFVIADIDNHRVRRVSPEGSMTTVAGSGGEPDAGADGTPAPGEGGSGLNAAVKPVSVSALADGGVLLADSVADRVYRVSAGGVISTFAGDGQKGSGGDSGPSPQASVWGPRGLGTRPDGGALIAEFGPDAQADAGGDRVRLVGGGLTPFALPAFRNSCSYAPAAAGPYAPPAAPAKRSLVLRMNRRQRGRARRPVRIRYRVSRRATVRFDILKGKRRVARKRMRVKAGRHRVTLRPGRRARGGRIRRRGLPRGRYRVRAVARTADRQVATAKARLIVRRRR